MAENEFVEVMNQLICGSHLDSEVTAILLPYAERLQGKYKTVLIKHGWENGAFTKPLDLQSLSTDMTRLNNTESCNVRKL